MLKPMTTGLTPPPDLPPGLATRIPDAGDVDALTELVATHQRAARGRASVERDAVAAVVTGSGSWTRRQLLAERLDRGGPDGGGPDRGGPVAWVWVHDRAAGRTVVELVVRPGLPEADGLAAALLGWAAAAGADIARLRELEATQLDAETYAVETERPRWLEGAGYARARTWLHLSRRVDDAETLAGPREGVRVRRVEVHDDGMPVASDIQVVHRMLEESFADHFNSYRESFPEFLQRLREDPGHRWDHWWVAEVEDGEGGRRPGGALVGSVLPPDDSGQAGSYVDYIGVHRDARGLGVAKALLGTVVRDAHARGRNRVDLVVDADSPTGADGLYAALGWTESYRTVSWHATARV
jgi:mycothiol synthase